MPLGSFACPPPHITWGSGTEPIPPAAGQPHLNFQTSTFLYGVFKKSTHHHTTVGLSCTQPRDLVASARPRPELVMHYNAGYHGPPGPLSRVSGERIRVVIAGEYSQ